MKSRVGVWGGGHLVVKPLKDQPRQAFIRERQLLRHLVEGRGTRLGVRRIREGSPWL